MNFNKRNFFLKKDILFIFSFFMVTMLSGCQIPYLVNNAYQHLKIMSKRQPLEDILKNETLSTETKNKLKLALNAKQFAESDLQLKPSDNYTSYVELSQPYITYIIMAAPKYRLESYKWSFPFVGKVPYKGFYTLQEAQSEGLSFDKEIYDVYVRGASAYSTLGWFNDPILSSMIRYSDHDLVELIIHETVHSTLYIKNNADFNERLATFVGQKGTEKFYLKTEGEESKTLKKIQQEKQDRFLFSQFISREIDELQSWYQESREKNSSLKQEQFNKIKDNFKKNVKPHLKTEIFDYFTDFELNNASLLSLKTYIYDLTVFEDLYTLEFKNDFVQFINYCKSLEKASLPEEALKKRHQLMTHQKQDVKLKN